MTATVKGAGGPRRMIYPLTNRDSRPYVAGGKPNSCQRRVTASRTAAGRSIAPATSWDARHQLSRSRRCPCALPNPAAGRHDLPDWPAQSEKKISRSGDTFAAMRPSTSVAARTSTSSSTTTTHFICSSGSMPHSAAPHVAIDRRNSCESTARRSLRARRSLAARNQSVLESRPSPAAPANSAGLDVARPSRPSGNRPPNRRPPPAATRDWPDASPPTHPAARPPRSRRHNSRSRMSHRRRLDDHRAFSCPLVARAPQHASITISASAGTTSGWLRAGTVS